MSSARDRLLGLLVERSYARKKVVLSSGAESDFFIDGKQTVLLAEGHALVGEVLYESLAELPTRPEAVAGVALGGCPLASAVALTSHLRGDPLDAVYVRKATKAHGSRRLIEGDSHLREGARLAVLEDVVTTGGSTLRAVEQLREAGYEIAGVVAIVDRREGAAAAIKAAGLPFVAVFGREDFPGGP